LIRTIIVTNSTRHSASYRICDTKKTVSQAEWEGAGLLDVVVLAKVVVAAVVVVDAVVVVVVGVVASKDYCRNIKYFIIRLSNFDQISNF